MRASFFTHSMIWVFVGLFGWCTGVTPVRGAVQSREVEYQDGATKLIGYLAWDDAVEGKRPGVLVVHEWWGLNDYARRRADQLAELGYVAFALDMYGDKKVTTHPEQAAEWAALARKSVEGWRRRALAGLEVLRKDEHTDPERCAAIGYCFGGATVLQLAYAGAPVRGVASFHGALPVLDLAKVKEVPAKILICHGADDGFVTAATIRDFQDALNKVHADWQMIYYSGAKHSFTNPDADKANMPGLAYHPAADRRSWQHLQLFLKELFP